MEWRQNFAVAKSGAESTDLASGGRKRDIPAGGDWRREV
jgi:hypothetical protein